MIRVLFICHGNICRSPMAEFVLKDMAARRGLASKFYIATEEPGRSLEPAASPQPGNMRFR